jgi:hypothetical protein
MQGLDQDRFVAKGTGKDPAWNLPGTSALVFSGVLDQQHVVLTIHTALSHVGVQIVEQKGAIFWRVQHI